MSGKKQKSIDRKIDVRGEERVVRQSWRANKTGLLLTSALLNKRTKQPLAGKLTALVADEVELLEVGRQHAEVFLQRAISRSSEIAGGAVGKRRRADIAVSNPMAAGLAGGTRRGDAAAAARKAEEEVRFSWDRRGCRVRYQHALIESVMYASIWSNVRAAAAITDAVYHSVRKCNDTLYIHLFIKTSLYFRTKLSTMSPHALLFRPLISVHISTTSSNTNTLL